MPWSKTYTGDPNWPTSDGLLNINLLVSELQAVVGSIDPTTYSMRTVRTILLRNDVDPTAREITDLDAVVANHVGMIPTREKSATATGITVTDTWGSLIEQSLVKPMNPCALFVTWSVVEASEIVSVRVTVDDVVKVQRTASPGNGAGGSAFFRFADDVTVKVEARVTVGTATVGVAGLILQQCE